MARRGRTSSNARTPSRTQTRSASTTSMAATRPMAPAVATAAPQQPGLFAQISYCRR
ncbi:hypothetical protein L0F63_003020, partial [Massospora cicadina]